MDNAEVYSKVKEIKYTRMHQLLKKYGSLLSWGPAEVVLDAGCGPGDVAADVLLPWLPPDCQAVLGVDISPNMVQHAISKHAGGKLDFAVADIGGDVSDITSSSYKYANGFHKIFSFFVMHWIQDLEKGIRNLKELLKPRGQILLYFPVDHSFKRTYKKVRAMDGWKEYFKGVTRKIPQFPEKDPLSEFEELTTVSGLQIETCELICEIITYPTVNKLKELIESLDPDFCCVPEDLQAQYLNDCFCILENDGAIVMEEDGRVTHKQTCLFAILRN